MFKKNRIFVFLIIFILFLAGCGVKPVAMDQLNEVGVYNYRNKDLGFQLDLPPEFVYYQTQRKYGSDYTDLEIFVPTSDINYPQDIQSYAKPIIIRVYTKDNWDKLSELDQEEGFIYLLESKKRVYAIKYWQAVPEDWEEKWSDDIRENILNSFKSY